MLKIQMRMSGECAVLLELHDATAESGQLSQVDPSYPAKLQFLRDVCQRLCADALIDIVPAYRTLLLVFAPYHPRWPAIIDELELHCQAWQQELTRIDAVQGRLIELPVWYGDFAESDLIAVAQRHQLTPQQVIDLHCQQPYSVYAIGFLPGFAYLGFIDAQIATPRHSAPRPLVPAGAVGIADQQTAVYPMASPGGWQLLGLCPTPLYHTASTAWCSVGDRVQFQPIDKALYQKLQQRQQAQVTV